MRSIHGLCVSPAQTEGVGNTSLIVAGTVIATAALLALLNRALYPTPPKKRRSPLQTVLPRLSQDELDKLLYKPDHFPGARDVETPVCLSAISTANLPPNPHSTSANISQPL